MGRWPLTVDPGGHHSTCAQTPCVSARSRAVVLRLPVHGGYREAVLCGQREAQGLRTERPGEPGYIDLLRGLLAIAFGHERCPTYSAQLVHAPDHAHHSGGAGWCLAIFKIFFFVRNTVPPYEE